MFVHLYIYIYIFIHTTYENETLDLRIGSEIIFNIHMMRPPNCRNNITAIILATL